MTREQEFFIVHSLHPLEFRYAAQVICYLSLSRCHCGLKRHKREELAAQTFIQHHHCKRNPRDDEQHKT